MANKLTALRIDDELNSVIDKIKDTECVKSKSALLRLLVRVGVTRYVGKDIDFNSEIDKIRDIEKAYGIKNTANVYDTIEHPGTGFEISEISEMVNNKGYR